VQLETETAGTFGLLTTALVWHRVNRHLPMLRGWPRLSVNMQHGPRQAVTLDLFYNDCQNYDMIADAEYADRFADITERSIFKTMPVQQLRAICEQERWVGTDALSNFVQDSSRGVISSQIAEDAFKRQRRKETIQANRRARMARAYHVLLQRQVAGSVHKYNEVEVDTAVDYLRRPSLPDKAFEPCSSIASVDLKGIIGYRSPDWYSPAAATWSVQYADLPLVAEARRMRQLDELPNAWLGSLLNVRHNIVIREVRSPRVFHRRSASL
jgi:hypothetical protein